jgi:hypothetical protein
MAICRLISVAAGAVVIPAAYCVASTTTTSAPKMSVRIWECIILQRLRMESSLGGLATGPILGYFLSTRRLFPYRRGVLSISVQPS